MSKWTAQKAAAAAAAIAAELAEQPPAVANKHCSSIRASAPAPIKHAAAAEAPDGLTDPVSLCVAFSTSPRQWP